MRFLLKPKLSRCDTDEPFKLKGKLAYYTDTFDGKFGKDTKPDERSDTLTSRNYKTWNGYQARDSW
jgi:hypothetical protein